MAALATVVGCGGREALDTSATDAGAEVSTVARARSSSASARLDLGEVARRARSGFHEVEAGWRGGHERYEAAVYDGRISVRPRRGDAAALELALVGVGREAASRPLDARVRREESGGLAITRAPGIEELLVNVPEGLEQSWRFSERPAGAGALTVRLSASGEAYRGSTAGGLHFADAATGVGVRYGAATWIDAGGTRTPVATAYESGAIVLTVPARVVDESRYPAVLDPTVSPESGADDIGFQPDHQGWEKLAYNGQNYLVVWTDFSNATTPFWAARVSPSGALLDPGGIALPGLTRLAAATLKQPPAVAALGTSTAGRPWLVLAPHPNLGVIALVVNADGSVGASQTLETGTNDAVALASNGSSFYAVWHDANDVVRGEVISSAGVPQAATLTQLLAGSGARVASPIGVAWGASANGGEYLVAAVQRGAAVNAIRVGGSGAVIGSPVALAGNGVTYGASVASDGTNFLVAWPTGGPGGSSILVHGDATKATLQNINAGSGVAFPSAYDGTSYVLGCLSASTYSGGLLKVSVAGTPDAAVTPILSADDEPALASDGASLLLIYDKDVNGSFYDIGQRATPALALTGAPFVLDRGVATTQSKPQVAWSASSAAWLVAWEDHQTGAANVFSTRIDAAGNVLDPWGILLPGAGTAPTPELAAAGPSNGSPSAVAWNELSVGATGQIASTPVFGGAGTPYCGTSHTYTTIGNSSALAFAANNTVALAVGSGGANYRYAFFDGFTEAVYADLGPGSPGTGTGSAAWASASGWFLVVTPSGFYKVKFGGGGPTQIGGLAGVNHSAIATDGTDFLVVYDNGSDVLGVKILGASATVAWQGPISATASSEVSPTVAWDGGQYWAIWQDHRGGVDYDLYGTRMKPDGTVVDPAGYLISNDVGDELTPSAAGGAPGEVLVAYQSTGSLGVPRMHARIVTDLRPAGAACASVGDCQPGLGCVDGYCCNATSCTGCMACSAAKTGKANGTCAAVVDGTDPNAACTATSCLVDACQSGACSTNVKPTSCYIAGICHAAGAKSPLDSCQVCAPGSSQTSFSLAGDGIPCDDGNACTQADSCQSGVCTGYSPVVCNATDACHVTGVCNPSTGACTNPAAPNGTSCDDGNACTQIDSCQSGVCMGTNPVVCGAADECHGVGVCSNASGLCSNPKRVDGTPCSLGGVPIVSISAVTPRV